MTRNLGLFLIFIFAIIGQTLFAQVGTEFWLAPPEATSGHDTDEPFYSASLQEIKLLR